MEASETRQLASRTSSYVTGLPDKMRCTSASGQTRGRVQTEVIAVWLGRTPQTVGSWQRGRTNRWRGIAEPASLFAMPDRGSVRVAGEFYS